MILYDKKLMNNATKVGGKAVGLSRLVNLGFCVPDFFVIPCSVINRFYEQSIKESCSLEQIMATTSEFINELEFFLKKLGGQHFAVRSSYADEDSMAKSFAGQFDTVLKVNKLSLLKSIEQVVSSSKTMGVSLYSEGKSSIKYMSVIIQCQIYGDISGVCFSQSPCSDTELIIEYVKGQGEQLVSGKITPTTLIFNKLKKPYSDTFSLNNICQHVIDLENAEGFGVDVEWTIKDDKLFFLQMRPLTTKYRVPKSITEKDWKFYVKHNFCPLAHSVQLIASLAEVQNKYFGFSCPIENGILIDGNEFYSTESIKKDIESWEKLDKQNFFDNYIEIIENTIKKCGDMERHLTNNSFCDISKAFGEWLDLYIESYCLMMLRPDDYLETKVLNNISDKQLMKGLTFVEESTAYGQIGHDFIKYALDFVQGDCEAPQNYIDKYQWTNQPLELEQNLFDKKIIIKQFREKTAQHYSQLLLSMDKTRCTNLQEKKNAFLSINKNVTLTKYACYLNKFIYYRSKIAEVSDRLFFVARNTLFKTVSTSLNTSVKQLLLMSADEVAEKLASPHPTTVKALKPNYLVLWNRGLFEVSYPKEYYSILAYLLGQVKSKSEDGITGQIASAGKIEGIVRIVKTTSDAYHLKKGEIMVTSMITPDLVLALNSAAGIITDEGGITCHAAIIAREFNIPCIVGTNCATKKLTDGMKVLLDATTGIVTVLNT